MITRTWSLQKVFRRLNVLGAEDESLTNLSQPLFTHRVMDFWSVKKKSKNKHQAMLFGFICSLPVGWASAQTQEKTEIGVPFCVQKVERKTKRCVYIFIFNLHPPPLNLNNFFFSTYGTKASLARPVCWGSRGIMKPLFRENWAVMPKRMSRRCFLP